MKQMKKPLLAILTALALTMPGCVHADTAGAGELARFFPFMPDTLLTFTVEGFEVPGTRTIFHAYIRENRVQRMIHASDFPPSIEIIEVGDEQVRLIFGDPHHYNIEDMTQVAPMLDFVILQAPIEVGTGWSNGGETSSITAVDVPVETPLGVFEAVQVTTVTTRGFEERYYYAEGIGLVKSVHPNDLGTFVVTLSEIVTDTAASHPLAVLFPNIEENTIEVEPRSLSVPTNGDFVPLLAQELAAPASDGVLPLLPDAAILNSIEVFRAENMAHVDVSSGLRDWQNIGDGTIGAVFMALTNTIGLFTEVAHVYYTMDGAPFEWGPIQLATGEAVRVHDFSEILGD